jgi:hypothetical protein
MNVSQEGPLAGVAWPVVLREHTANDVLVNLDAEDMRELLGNAHTAKLGIAGLQLNDRRNEFCGRTFGTWFGGGDEVEKRRYF